MNEISLFLSSRDVLTWSVVLLAALAGGLLRGLTGFGAALLMAPLLSMVLSARETMCLVTLLNALPLGRATLRAAGRAIDREVMLPMIAAAFVGVPCGIALVGALPAQAFGAVIGAAVIASALALMSGITLVSGRSLHGSLGFGMLSGVLTGFGGVGGPPAILYLLGVEPDSHRARANFIVFFAGLYPVALAALALLGMMHRGELLLGAMLAPLFHLGGVGGARLYRRVGKRQFRPFVLLLLVAAGLMAAWPRALPAQSPAAPAHMGAAAGSMLVRHARVQCAAPQQSATPDFARLSIRIFVNSNLRCYCAPQNIWHRNC